jgi:hypothetical protein
LIFCINLRLNAVFGYKSTLLIWVVGGRASFARSLRSFLFLFFFTSSSSSLSFFLCQFMCRRIIERGDVAEYSYELYADAGCNELGVECAAAARAGIYKKHHQPKSSPPDLSLTAQCSFTLESISQAIDYGLMYRTTYCAIDVFFISSFFYSLLITNEFAPLKKKWS